jgi:hypothetical protein
MVKNFEDLQQVGKENVDTALKSWGALSKGTQAIALEKLFGVKSFDKAIELQAEYAKLAYEGLVAEAGKIGELYADLAKETYKPIEALMAKAAK